MRRRGGQGGGPRALRPPQPSLRGRFLRPSFPPGDVSLFLSQLRRPRTANTPKSNTRKYLFRTILPGMRFLVFDFGLYGAWCIAFCARIAYGVWCPGLT
eukprot:1331443-Rhodomonas_salina.1